ncbi:hypothetical protein KFL_000060210 [Klebsormidium nitens]|uniref:DUF4211 domain-containing protein n=1 Tax=Klebsormidium nitens TaxID=105231 RepID=A0A0U9I6A9_KLENI|nr:hypothetical protein KFL_000060210 [Klebsormidium nitens]|eukprot:GAQ77956.1 hypothetical protein KFL_000060210 [Klebsormidium nitens]
MGRKAPKKPARKRKSKRLDDDSDDRGDGGASDSEYEPGSDEEEEDEEIDEEDSELESESTSEEEMEKSRRNSRSSSKKLPPQGKGSKRRRKKGDGGNGESDASRDFVWELQIRKVWKTKPQDGQTGPWKKVTVNELFDILKLQVTSFEEEGGPSRVGISGAKEGGSKRKRQVGSEDDVSEPRAGGKRKSARLSSGRGQKRRESFADPGNIVGSDEDDGSVEEIPRERVTPKGGGRRKSKGNKFVAGGEARSDDDEEEGDDDLSDFIDDTEVGEGGAAGRVSEDEEGKESGEEGDADEGKETGSDEECGSSRRRLQKVQGGQGNGDSLPELSVELEDFMGEHGPSSSRRKSKRMVESEGEEEADGGEGQGVARKADSPEIPLKGGLTSPVALEIPEVQAEAATEVGGSRGGPESLRKRRRVELLEEDKDEESEARAADEGVGQVEGKKSDHDFGIDENIVQAGGKDVADLHEEQGTQAAEIGGQAECEDGFGKGKDAEFDGGGKENGSAMPESTGNEVSAEAPEAAVEIDGGGGRGKRSRRSDVSLDEVLVKMIDHRNKVLGLTAEEEEDELEGEENEDDTEDVTDFVVPDEDGDYQGYGEGAEAGGGEKGASEGGESEGEPTGEDEEVVQKEDFEMFVEYVLRTIQDPEYKKEARRDDELMASVRRSEEALTSRRTQLVESTAWTPEFKRALDSRPGLACRDTRDHEDCQACGRANHPSTHIMVFSGERLRPGEVWEFDMAVSAASRLHNDNEGEEDENEGEEFLVGRFCYARAMAYHALHHYKWRFTRRLRKVLAKAGSGLKGEDAISAALMATEVISRLHRNINRFVNAAERFRDRTQDGKKGLVTMEEMTEEDRFLEMVEELDEGGIVV